MTRQVTIHCFCSTKGGVGKSSLAMACGKLLIERSHPTVVFDADVTGTSLADGLDLVAPVLPENEAGVLDLLAPPTGEFRDLQATWGLRARRGQLPVEAPPSFLPFVTDALAYMPRPGDEDCRVDAMLWRHCEDDGLRFLPSSSLERDVRIAVGHLYHQPPMLWSARIAWVLEMLAERMPSLRDIVIDLPPGLLGVAHATLALLGHLDRREALPEVFPEMLGGAIEWSTNPFLVCSQDRNDLFMVVEAFAALRRMLPSLRLLLNRRTEGMGEISNALTRRFGAPLLDGLLFSVGLMPRSLGTLFVDQRLRAPGVGHPEEKEWGGLVATLRLEGAR
jgi:hypothetical protein